MQRNRVKLVVANGGSVILREGEQSKEDVHGKICPFAALINNPLFPRRQSRLALLDSQLQLITSASNHTCEETLDRTRPLQPLSVAAPAREDHVQKQGLSGP